MKITNLPFPKQLPGMTGREYFQKLAEAYPLIRMHGKRPIEKNWPELGKQRREFHQIGFEPEDNAGIGTGPASGLLVVDVDDADLFMQTIKERGWKVPDTLTVFTGSGKYHIYFQYPQNGTCYGRKTLKAFGFEIFGEGGVITAPGSIHPETGKPYQVGIDKEILPAPEWLLRIYSTSQKSPPTPPDSDNTPQEILPPKGELGGPLSLNKIPVSDHVKHLIEEDIPKGQRSEAIMTVVNALVYAGVKDELIFKVFEKYPIGEKYREKGSSKGKWLMQHIHKAKEFVGTAKKKFFDGKTFLPEPLVDHILTDVDVFNDGNQFYLYDEGKGVWKARHKNVLGDKMRLAIGPKAKSSHIQDALKMLETRVFEEPEDLEPGLRLINLENGMLEIESGVLKKHDKSYRSTVQIPIEFDPQAKSPRFKKYLQEVFPDDPGKITTLQEFAGYCLYPRIFIHKCLFLIGSGANGKSLFINILIKVIGIENVAALELHLLSHRFLVGTLKDKLLNVSSEVQTNSKVQENVFKQVISGDLIQADVKHRDSFNFRPIAKHIFSMNEIPVITDRTYALARRLIVVKFNQRFEGDREDKRLEDKLTKELPGILNWCLEGLRRVVENDQIAESKQMEGDKQEFLRAINPVANFVDEACGLNKSFKVGKNSLYQGYVQYCSNSGLRPTSNIKFYRQLLSDYPQIVEKRPEGGERCFVGIDLLEPMEPYGGPDVRAFS